MISIFKYPLYLDHLVYTARTLSEGMDSIEKIMGVRPVIGGQHPRWGTHNALLSLGEKIYLEVIAPDPDLPQPEKGFLPKEIFKGAPKLTTWVMRTAKIEEMYHALTSAELKIGALSEGSRMKPDGSLLSWKLTDPSVFTENGAIPFLIDWGDSVHPAQVLPRGGELMVFSIEHPDPESLGHFLRLMECDIHIDRSSHVRLRATIKTSGGMVTLS